MTGTALIRPVSAVAWELRAAWASGRRVALTIATGRLEGHVTAVAATDAYVRVGRTHVPLAHILAVHLPSRLGDSTVRAAAFHAPARALERQPDRLF